MDPQPQIDFDPSIDYYATLGITAEASGDDVKRAYRQLARRFHPDSTGGDKSKELLFRKIQSAYDVLGDPTRRRLYDEILIRAHRPRGSYSQDTGPTLGTLIDDLFRPTSKADAPVNDAPDHVSASDGSTLRVEGADVYSDARISFDRAITGAAIIVATIDGDAPVKIPPGTSSGAKLRLRGRGITDRSGSVGDHYVIVQIDVPSERDLDDIAKEILAKFVRRLDL